MQPLNDDELKKLMSQWKAPAAPEGFEKSVMAAAKEPSKMREFFVWLATGSIRIPVPLGVAVAVVLLVLALRPVAVPKPPAESSLAEFQPVKEFKPRIIRSSYENK